MIFLHVVFYTRKRSWKWYDLLHIIPVLIYILDYQDVLLMSATDKRALILQEINDLDSWMLFNQSRYFSPGFHMVFRIVALNIYWVAQVVVFVRWLRNQTSMMPEDKVWKNWMWVFLGYQFFMFFPFYLNYFWLNVTTSYHIMNSFAILWVMVVSLSLFFFPSILYGPKRVVLADGKNDTKVQAKAPLTDAEQQKLAEVMQIITTQL